MRWLRRLRGERREVNRLRNEINRTANGLVDVDRVDAFELHDRLDEILAARLAPPRYRRVGGHVPPPVVGQAEFLVFGECDCGWRCACPEGWLWPLCPNCGKQVLPPRGHRTFPGDHGDRLGYVAELVPEDEAIALVRERDRGPDA